MTSKSPTHFIFAAFKMAVLFLALLAFIFPSELVAQEGFGSNFYYVTNANNTNTISLLLYSGTNKIISVPTNINGLTVTGLSDDNMYAVFPSATLSVTIPGSVTNIAPGALTAANLTNVTLSAGLLSIGQYAFENDSHLSTISIPNTVTNIGSYAFQNCQGLTSVSIPGNVTNFPTVFSQCTALTNATINPGATSVPANAFYQCPNLTGISIPASVTNIGNNAFYQCASLATVTIPGSLSNFTFSAAFSSCPSLVNVIFASGSTNIAPSELLNQFRVTGVTIPDTVTNIGSAAFQGSGIRNVYIPESVASIGAYAFDSCASLAAFTVDLLNSNYSSIDGVLFDKAGQTLIKYPGGHGAIYSIPNGITNILFDAFGVSSVASLTIPGSVSQIGNYTFETCRSLTNVMMENGVASIGYEAFLQCTYLQSVSIPGSVTNIGQSAFAACDDLVSVSLGNGVANIPVGAFAYDGMTNIVIPGSLTNIAADAFLTCENLSGVYFLGNAPVCDSTAFNGSPATLYYLPQTTGWDQFATNTGFSPILWNPSIQTSGSGFGLQNQQFGFDIAGTNNFTMTVFACSNLAAPAWVPLQTVMLTNGFWHFADAQATNFPGRFYSLGLPRQ